MNAYVSFTVKNDPFLGRVTRPTMQCLSSRTMVGLYSIKKNSALVFTTPTNEATWVASSSRVSIE